MQSNHKTTTLKIDGMTCASCAQRIERKLKHTKGVMKVKVSYARANAECIYDPHSISIQQIKGVIEKLGYTVVKDSSYAHEKGSVTKVLGAMIVIFSLYNLMKYFGFTNLFYVFPEAQENMGYGMLFIIGVLTSIHCVAMCGGINLSQCMKQPSKGDVGHNRFSALRPSFLYNLGRVISYTLVGGIIGALGSVVSFSGNAKGMVQLITGVFMMIMGFNMLNIFPWLRHFNVSMPKVFLKKANVYQKSNSPLYVGLINGLMPCGPLQAMQLYSLSTGSMVKGAFAMFLFSLGTVPLMFGIGALSSILTKKFTDKVMAIGAVLVVILGLSMFSSGLSLSGVAIPGSIGAEGGSVVRIDNGVQVVKSSLAPGQYPSIQVQAGVPVKWTINAEKGTVNGCNNRIFIPDYGIEKKFQVGENIIEFTPTKEGAFSYSCWMGMIRGSIIVTKHTGK